MKQFIIEARVGEKKKVAVEREHSRCLREIDYRLIDDTASVLRSLRFSAINYADKRVISGSHLYYNEMPRVRKEG